MIIYDGGSWTGGFHRAIYSCTTPDSSAPMAELQAGLRDGELEVAGTLGIEPQNWKLRWIDVLAAVQLIEATS